MFTHYNSNIKLYFSFLFYVANDLGLEEHLTKYSYQQWVENIKSSVPEERLLVINLRDEWEGLCHFLNVSKPDTPFPRVIEDNIEKFQEEIVKKAKEKDVYNEPKPLPHTRQQNYMKTYAIPFTLFIFVCLVIRKRPHIRRALTTMYSCPKCFKYTIRNLIEGIINVALNYVTSF